MNFFIENPETDKDRLVEAKAAELEFQSSRSLKETAQDLQKGDEPEVKTKQDA